MMFKTSLLAIPALALMIGVAHAGAESDPFADAVSRPIVANQVVGDTGAEFGPQFGSGVTLLTQGNVLPTNGANGIVQTANSLPAGFEDGTVAYAQARSVQQWVLAHQAPAPTRLAAR